MLLLFFVSEVFARKYGSYILSILLKLLQLWREKKSWNDGKVCRINLLQFLNFYIIFIKKTILELRFGEITEYHALTL